MKKYSNLKKVELHCHLDGSLSPTKVSKWTRKDIKTVEKSLIVKKPLDLQAYLEHFNYAINLLQTKTRLKEAAFELCKDMLHENVIYAEIRFDPVAHTKKGLTLKEIVESVLEGISSSNLKAKLILCMKRERDTEVNKSVIDIAKKYLKKGVAAVDLAGSEENYPTNLFKDLFTYAKEQEVPFVIHAGEAGTFKDIEDAINFGAKRIGHGVKAIKDFRTMETLKQKDIPLEVCLTSNIMTKTYDNFKEHPVRRLIDSGISVTINTDNRTLSYTTLTDEYNLLNKHFGFSTKEFNEMNKIAIKHAFLTDREKEELLKNFS